MTIPGFVSRNLRQTAVYWGNPQEDGYGGKTYDPPIEIACRWEDKTQVFNADDEKGSKYISRAIIYTPQDLNFDGRIFLGTFLDLVDHLQSDGVTYENPINIDAAYIIKRTEKTPSLLSSSVFLYKTFLTPWLAM